MEFKSENSRILYGVLRKCGYNEELCEVMTQYYLTTDYTAGRMLGYLGRIQPPQEELVDEMLAILEDRERFVKKHIAQESQMKINEFYQDADRFEED